MYFLILSRQILSEMGAHKLRSALALFGIFWGTLTVILLLALGGGFHQASQQKVGRIADGVIFAMPGVRDRSWLGIPKGQPLHIQSHDVLLIAKNVPNIQTAMPVLVNQADMSYSDRLMTRYVIGTTSNFSWIRKVNLMSGGRFFNSLDVDRGGRVVVLGYRLKQHLFGAYEDAVGKRILLHNALFTVIGVIQPPEKNMYNDDDRMALIPYTAYISLFGDADVTYFMIYPNPTADPYQVQRNFMSYLSAKYRFNPQDQTVLHVFNTTKFFQFLRWFFIGIQLFLGLCGGLTLAVGSLGVANIMFLIVTERTSEIGLRMALGATKRKILMQILLEALLLVALGGLLGFLTALLIIGILQYVPLPAMLGKP